MDNTMEIRREIIAVGQMLLDKGLVAGTWGNISARVPGTPYIAVTPSGRNYRTLAPGDIVITDLQGGVIDGALKPSSELPLHLAIYRERQDIGAIVHTHSVFASAFAVAHMPIPPVIEDLVQLVGGSVEVADYALPGTPQLAQNAVRALGSRNAVLMANHGMAGCGASLPEAMLACELVEKTAQIYVYARQIGVPQVLGEEDVAIMHRFYEEYYRQRQQGRNI